MFEYTYKKKKQDWFLTENKHTIHKRMENKQLFPFFFSKSAPTQK